MSVIRMKHLSNRHNFDADQKENYSKIKFANTSGREGLHLKRCRRPNEMHNHVAPPGRAFPPRLLREELLSGRPSISDGLHEVAVHRLTKL
jgi:hypothetical protein